MCPPTDPEAYDWPPETENTFREHIQVLDLRAIPESWSDLGYTTDDDLPGQWSRSDFEGGDPDERSYAQREVDRMLCNHRLPTRGAE